MKALVKIIDFHWDNYQGGSGKNVEYNCSIKIPDEMMAKEILTFINEKIVDTVILNRPFKQNDRFIIKSINLNA